MMNRKTVRIEHTALRHLLSLPEDIEILSLEVEQNPLSLTVNIAGDRLPMLLGEEESRVIYRQDMPNYYISLLDVQSL